MGGGEFFSRESRLLAVTGDLGAWDGSKKLAGIWPDRSAFSCERLPLEALGARLRSVSDGRTRPNPQKDKEPGRSLAHANEEVRLKVEFWESKDSTEPDTCDDDLLLIA